MAIVSALIIVVFFALGPGEFQLVFYDYFILG